ncbi:MAG: hypothetical protein HY060_10850 [Proteobacteria bacterium]|nr:hypothetical protein [Pseudomonadota bacterium]
MNYRWMLPAAAMLGFVVLMGMAKDGVPWPVSIGLAMAFLACAGLTMLVHDRGRRAPAVTRPSRGR